MNEAGRLRADPSLTGQMALVAKLGVMPRLMCEDLAAFYVGVSKTTFREGWQSGRWPKPERFGERVLWDRYVIDRTIDAQSGIPQPRQGGATDSTWDDL